MIVRFKPLRWIENNATDALELIGPLGGQQYFNRLLSSVFVTLDTQPASQAHLVLLFDAACAGNGGKGGMSTSRRR